LAYKHKIIIITNYKFRGEAIMNAAEYSLKILETLVESAGGSIEPFRHILVKNNNLTPKTEINQINALFDKTIDGFFHCAAKNITFTDISKIKNFFGRTIEEAYPGVSPTFIKLARTYWTFKVFLNESPPDPSVVFSFLQMIEVSFAGVFFPFPGPIGPSKKKREETMRTLIKQSGANFDEEDYIRGNYYLK
jgi:hypothetical protein